MYLVEKHIIRKGHKFYSECDRVSFLSKNLYNAANYLVRNVFIESTKEKEAGQRDKAFYTNFYEVNRRFVEDNQVDYYALPCMVSQQTLMMLDKNWKSFFKSIKQWSKNKSSFKGKPNLPKYLPKDGRYLVKYSKQSVFKKFLRDGVIKLSKTDIEFNIHNKLIKDTLQEVRIVPRLDYYVIEVVYKVDEPELKKDNGKYAAIDLGLSNLATLTTNIKSEQPKVFNGRPLKSVNQYYNKRLAHYKSKLEKTNKKKSSKRTRRLTNKRTNKVNDYLHKTSKAIVTELKQKTINTLVVGKNTNWKQNINIGKVNNQNFVSLPYDRLISMLEYKCKLNGINFILTEESYTSKASFLDGDDIPTYKKGESIKPEFSGKRTTRGLYKSSRDGTLINADVNGSFNILKKAVPDAFVDGIEDVVVHPKIITILN